MNTMLTRLPVNPRAEPLVPTVGVYSVAASLCQAGFSVAILDAFADRACHLLQPDFAREALAGVDVLGVSIDSFNWGMTAMALESAKSVRPDIVTVVGGIHAWHMPGQVAAHPAVDYVVVGDGGDPMVALLEAIDRGRRPSDVPGLMLAEDGRLIGEPPVTRSLSDLPIPAFDLVPPDVYPALPFASSRGCPGRCRFCSVTQQRYQRLSPPETAERLAAVRELGAGRFTSDLVFITDDCFSGDVPRATELCQEFLAMGLSGKVGMEVRASDVVRGDLAAALGQLGPAFVEIGAECGYDEGLARLAKGITTDDLVRAATSLDAIRDRLLYSFMIGLPWEGEPECMRTVEFAAALARDYGVTSSLSWYSLLPSELWHCRRDYGIDVDEDMFLLPSGGNRELFARIHPRLVRGATERIQDAIDQHKASGVKIDRIVLWRH